MSQPLPFVDINPATEVKATVIWLHGLGDSGHGFAPIVPELRLPESLAIRFVFPHAPERPVTINGGMRMRAWYDIKSMDFDKRADLGGVKESAALVEQLIEDEIAKGVPASRIILAGFSQGGVIALHLGTRYSKTLAGILALSTYMCEPSLLAEEAHDANKQTPIQFGHGTHDDVVPVAMGQAAYQTLKDVGYQAKWKTYAMQHNVCMDEINDISAWIQARLT
ncbi:carboxylesterase [Alteromonas sp. I4]|nr:carboxylesterase [Alteromonas sp. I4]